MLKTKGIFTRIAAAALSASIAIGIYVPAGGTSLTQLSFDSELCSVVEGTNVGADNYEEHDSPEGSYLQVLDDGIMRVQASDSPQYSAEVQYFNYSEGKYQFKGCKHILKELPLFGGFYASSDGYYYLLTGQANTSASATSEVFRITKYNYNWKRLGQASVSCAKTKVPFDKGSAAFAESNGYLIIKTCHSTNNLKDEVNLFDQSSVLLVYDMASGTVIDKLLGNEAVTDSAGFVYRSLGQKLTIDRGYVVSADHSDYIDRGISLSFMVNPVEGGNITGDIGGGKKNYNRAQITVAAGELGDIDTDMSLGGLEMSTSSYLVAYNKYNNDSDKREVYVGVSAKASKNAGGDYVIGAASNKQITNYAEESTGARTPKLVKLESDKFMVLWQHGKKVCWTLINGSGAPLVGETYTISTSTDDAELSDCQPVVFNGKVTWFTYNESTISFYSVKADYSDLEKDSQTTGHDLTWVSTNQNGIATFRCKKCNANVTQVVPKLIWVSTKTDLDDEYHFNGSDKQKKYSDISIEKTQTLYLMYEFDSESYPADNEEIELAEYDEEMLRFDDEAVPKTLSPLKVGRTSAVFKAKYNPNATFTLNITINGQCFVDYDPTQVDITKDGEPISGTNPVYLDDQLTITAKDRYGYRLKAITANGKTVADGGTYKVQGDTEIVAEWADKYVLSYPSGVIVTRNGEAVGNGEFVDKGEKLIITAEPPVGKNLSSFTVNGKTYEVTSAILKNGLEYTVPNLDEAEEKTVVVTAAYADRLRLVIPPAYAENIEVKKGSEVLENGAYLDAGDKIVVKMTVPDNKVLRSLTVNGDAIASGATYTVNDNEDKLVNIVVTLADRAKVMFDEATVSVTRSGKAITNETYISKGDVLKIKITPPEGKRLESLSINGEDIEYPETGSQKYQCSYTVTADSEGIVENVVIAPNFGDKFRLVKPDNVTVKRGTALLEDNDELEAGDRLTITAVPPEGMRLVSLTFNGVEIKSGSVQTVVKTEDGKTVVAVEYLPKFRLIKPEYVNVTRVVSGKTETLEDGALLDVGNKLTITVDLPISRRLTDAIYLNGKVITSGYKHIVDDEDVEIVMETAENYKVYVGDGTSPDNVVITKNGTALSSGDYVNDGDVLTVKAIPPENMRLAALYANDDLIVNGICTVNGEDVVIEAEFAEKYKVTFTANVTVTKNGTELESGAYIDEDDKLLIIVTPPENMRLSELYVNEKLVTYSGGYTKTVDGDVDIEAVFEEKYKVTFPESITVKKNGTALISGDYIDEGDILTITAAPPENKRVASLKVNGTAIKSGGTCVVEKDTNITVEYGDKFRLTVPENVTVKKGTTVLENGALLDDDDKLTITAVPPEGLRLIWLKVNDTEIKNKDTYIVESDVVITVLFADKYRLTVPENVTVKKGASVLENGALLDIGDKLVITAVPPEGKRLISLKVNGTEITNGSTYTVETDTVITVSFDDKFRLTVPEYVTVKRGAEELDDGALIDTGEKLVITADPPESLRLVSLKVNDETFKSGNTYTVAGDTIIEAEFEDRNTVTIPDNVTVKRNGTELSDGSYIDPGDRLVITATAPAGKNLVGLYVNQESFKSGSTYTVKGDTVIEVEFTDRMRVTYPANVTVKKNNKTVESGDFVDIGDKLVITAVSPAGRNIIGLYVNGTAITSGSTYTVTGNTEITVKYENGFLLTKPDHVTVTRNGKSLADGSSLESGDKLIITASAPAGKIVSTLRVNGEAEENGLTYTVTGDTVITVEYDDDPEFSSEITGNITLSGSETGSITVELYDKDGNKVRTVTSENGKFDFDKLAAGDYEVRISRDHYVTRTYKVTVGTTPVDINAQLRLYGDITGDNVTDAKDATQILRFDAGISSLIKKSGADADPYLVAVGCIKNVLIPDAKDATQILRFDAGMASLLFTLLGLI